MEHFYNFIITYKYLILLLAAIFEGPFVAIFAGILVKFNQSSFIPTYIILVLGNVLPDFFYYGVGYLGQKNIYTQKIINKFSFIKNNFKLIEKLWKSHFKKTIFLSKFAYGLSTPFLISAGLVKVSFSKFSFYTTTIDLFSIAFFISLGIIFGKTSDMFSQYIDYFAITLAFALILFIIIFNYLSRKASKEIIKLNLKK